MRKFKYTAVNIEKKKFSGTFLAEDENELRRRLAQQNLYLISCKPAFFLVRLPSMASNRKHHGNLIPRRPSGLEAFNHLRKHLIGRHRPCDIAGDNHNLFFPAGNILQALCPNRMVQRLLYNLRLAFYSRNLAGKNNLRQILRCNLYPLHTRSITNLQFHLISSPSSYV